MYKITCDDVLIALNASDVMSIVSGSIDYQVNSSASITFSLLPNNPMIGTIVPRKSEVIVYKNGSEIWSGQITSHKIESNGIVTYSGVDSLSYLQDSVQAPFTFTGSANKLFGNILDIHNQQIEDERKKIIRGNISKSGLGTSITVDYTSFSTTWKIISDLISDYGGYIQLRYDESGNRCIDWLDDSGVFIQQPIMQGYNLTDIETEEDASDVVTCLIGEGKDGITAQISDSDAVDRYGLIYDTVKNDDLTTEDELIQYMENELSILKKQSNTISASAVDMSDIDNNVERFTIGGFARVISKAHNVDSWIVVSKMSVDLSDKTLPKITLGSIDASISSVQSSTDNVNAWVQTTTDREPERVLAIDISGAKAIDTYERYGYAENGR